MGEAAKELISGLSAATVCGMAGQPGPDLVSPSVGSAIVSHDRVGGVSRDRGLHVVGLMRGEICLDHGRQILARDLGTSTPVNGAHTTTVQSPSGRVSRAQTGLMHKGLTIGEFATLTHLSVRTLRRYHEAGLLVRRHSECRCGLRFPALRVPMCGDACRAGLVYSWAAAPCRSLLTEKALPVSLGRAVREGRG